jgi:hypothetical protein
MLHLQLFADGGAAGAAGDGGTAQGQGATAGAASQQTTGAKNSLSDVKYGIQPEESAPAAEVKQETAEHTDPEAEFEALIKGKYKSQYDTRVQNTIQNRLKGSKEIAEKFNDAAPILEFLAKKYGVDAKDVKALRAAFEDDEAHYEKEAMELDMPVEQVKNMHKANREIDELRRTVQHMQAKEEADRRLAVWMQQEEATKKVYPNFDMETELKNPQFVELINNNIDVKTAFEVLHHDEIFPAAMQYTAKAVEEKITKKIAANGARPSENGTGARASAVVKSDVSKLTKYDIDEVARRVARGERVTFG